ncbi:unnamed protein product [Rotaria sordida]|uniref:Small ribosomal subunit protein mS29 n=1 Tax=Rotaria sordida TaxID=392033 RepID=A0A815BFK2_9BILA|nr:unnamed protein product [Rotaria sordida]CAF1266914.1 unnamed protein product [Rotaria sordida]CAF1336554.1 unnamed protein product [Rotaria sordida]CAF1594586.1 unnamed protein product [Rotaria sordida]CAF3623210.1 unnamed protein product [Rotaria sordida]
MTLISSCLIRARLACRPFYRFYANSAPRTIDVHSIPQEPIETKAEQPFRTSIDDPTLHTEKDLGLFYTVNSDDFKKISPFGKALPLQFREECEAFNETAIMIRQPSLDIIKLIKQINWNLPPLKVVLFPAELGVGMSLCLFHVIHYGYRKKMLLVNTPTAAEVLKLALDATPSPNNEQMWDTPSAASTWLKTFAINNEAILRETDFRTKFTYTWSARESTPAGTHLLDLIGYATDRIKYASECVGAIVKEVKAQVREKNIQTLVTFDTINSYYGPTWIVKPDKSIVKPNEVTMVKALQELLLPDWNNAFIVVTIGPKGIIIPKVREKHNWLVRHGHFRTEHRLPGVLMYDGPMTVKSLLGTEGIEALEPFVPIQVEKYTENEFNNQYRYYIDRNWIQNYHGREEEGRKEILFFTARNPYEMAKFVGSR